MGTVSFVVGYQELTSLTPPLSSLLRRKPEPSTAAANSDRLFGGEITPLKPNSEPC